MGYLAALQQMASRGMGKPPANPRNVGTPPLVAAKPHIEAAPYDVAMDPGWKQFLDPSDHELRNALNEMTPEVRQMLLQRVMQMKGPIQPGGVPQGVPPDAQQGLPPSGPNPLAGGFGVNMPPSGPTAV
jgi:hypothetical protein